MSELHGDILNGMRYDTRVAVVTGAAGGIGRAIKDTLLKLGATVVGTDIQPQQAIHEGLTSDRLFALSGDITDPIARERTMTMTKKLGGISLLVNNAGYFEREIKPHPTPEELRYTMAVNFESAYLLAEAAAQQMVELGIKGSIVNISSIHGQGVLRRQPHYSASKAALDASMLELAHEYAGNDIRINTIAPGAIDTTGKPSSFGKVVPMRRKGSPQDIANVVAFLGSDLAGYITGATIPVDGGLRNVNWLSDNLEPRP